MVPTDISRGRLEENKIGLHLPADLLEMIPALAWAASGQGEIEDFNGRPRRCDCSASQSSTTGSNPRSSLTPRATPIESPVMAIRNVPTGLETAYWRSRIPRSLVRHVAPLARTIDRLGMSTTSRSSAMVRQIGCASPGSSPVSRR